MTPEQWYIAFWLAVGAAAAVIAFALLSPIYVLLYLILTRD